MDECHTGLFHLQRKRLWINYVQKCCGSGPVFMKVLVQKGTQTETFPPNRFLKFLIQDHLQFRSILQKKKRILKTGIIF